MSQGRSTTMRGGGGGRLVALLVAALALLPCLRSLNHGFVWDDHELIERNVRLLENPGEALLAPFTLGGERSAYYRPAVLLSLSLDHALWGLNPRGYHLTNLLVYAVTAVGLLLLCLDLLPLAGAALAAAFFALHPVHVESVAFVSGRSDLLAGLFLVGTMISLKAFLRRDGRQALFLGLAGSSYLLALLSKESAAHLPLLVPLLYLLLSRRGFGKRRLAWTAGAVLIPFAIYLALRTYAFRDVGAPVLSTGTFPLRDYPWFFLQSLKLLFAPIGLLPYYEAPATGMGTTAALLLLLGALAILLRRLARGAGGGGVIAAAAAWIPLALLPALPIFRQAGAILADRFLYVPSLGAAVLLGASLEPALALLGRPRTRRALYAGLAAALAAAGIWSGVRAGDWRDDLTLFESAVRRKPDSVVLNYLLADEYLNRARPDDAERHLERALELAPRYRPALVALGDIRRRRGETGPAEQAYRAALESDPGDSGAAFGLGSIAMDKGDSAAARSWFLKALERDPHLAAAHLNLGNLAYFGRDAAGAERHWSRALEEDPGNTLAMNNLGVLAKSRGDLARARRLFERALAIDPAYTDAQRNLQNLGSSAR